MLDAAVSEGRGEDGAWCVVYDVADYTGPEWADSYPATGCIRYWALRDGYLAEWWRVFIVDEVYASYMGIGICGSCFGGPAGVRLFVSESVRGVLSISGVAGGDGLYALAECSG